MYWVVHYTEKGFNVADFDVLGLTTSSVEFTCSDQVRHMAGSVCFVLSFDTSKGEERVTEK